VERQWRSGVGGKLEEDWAIPDKCEWELWAGTQRVSRFVKIYATTYKANSEAASSTAPMAQKYGMFIMRQLTVLALVTETDIR
jgi:hypothetical protein